MAKSEWTGRVALATFLIGLLAMGYAAAQSTPFDLDKVFGVASAKYLGNCDVGVGPDLGMWFKLTLFALGIGCAVAAVGYAMSGMMGTVKYMAFAKGTLWGVVEGAVFLSVFSLMFVGLGKFGNANIDTARTYSSIIRNTAIYDFTMTITASTLFTFFSKQNPQFRFPGLEGWYLGFQLSPMFRPVFDALGMVTQVMTVAVVEWTSHEFLLCFIKTSMISLLMPAGIFLRVFGIKAGANAVIGLALALYFVYPWLMIVIGEALSDYFRQEITGQLAQPIGPNTQPPVGHPLGCLETPICCVGPSPEPSGNEPFIWNGPANKISQMKVLAGEKLLPGPGSNEVFCVYSTGLAKAYRWVFELVDTLGAGSLLAIPAAGAIATIAEYFNVSFVFIVFIVPFIIFTFQAIYETVFFLFVVSLVLPIFAIFITITVAKEFAKLLGTEIDLSAIEKII